MDVKPNVSFLSVVLPCVSQKIVKCMIRAVKKAVPPPESDHTDTLRARTHAHVSLIHTHKHPHKLYEMNHHAKLMIALLQQ